MIDRLTLLAAAPLWLALPRLAQAQTLETAKVLCGFPAGGTTDAVSRRVADKLRGGYARVAWRWWTTRPAPAAGWRPKKPAAPRPMAAPCC